MTLISINKRLPTWSIPGELLFIGALLILWWLYLCLTTQPLLVFDGIGYQELGRLIDQKGFGAYLHEGPNREPLFPLLVAGSMWIAEHCHVAYQYPLRLMGMTSLLITLVISHRLMLLLKINRLAAALGIAYLGFSPTLLNSTLWLWSEFAAYPFVVFIVWRAIKSWQFFNKRDDEVEKSLTAIGWQGALLALSFIGLMCVKAIAQAVIFLYLIPFMIQIFSRFKKSGWASARPWFIFVVSALLIFEGFVQGYQWLNLTTNGHYQFTNRGDWAFYSNTERRMEPLTLKRLGAAAVMAADGELCVRAFGYPDCAFWSARHSDDISDAKARELEDRHLTDEQKTRYYIHQGVRMMMANPAQALLTMLIEAHKNFFWETSPNFVVYPEWMDKFIYNQGLILMWKMGVAFVCWAGFITAAWMLLWRRHSQWLSRDEGVVLWFIFSFIFCYAAVYSLFFILDRYTFPIVSLMMVLVSLALSRLGARIKWPTKGPLFHLEKGTKLRMLLTFLFLLCLVFAPLVDLIKKQRQGVKDKSKFVSLQYYKPYFPYFASIAAGISMPDGQLMDGYHFGTGYTFYTYFKMAADFYPDNDVPQALSGFCRYYRGDIQGAEADYEKAFQLNPDFWWNDYNLGVIYFNKGYLDKSAFLLNRLLSLDEQASLTYMRNSSFYEQIWQYIPNPGQALANNLQIGREKALWMLQRCHLKGHHAMKAQALRIF